MTVDAWSTPPSPSSPPLPRIDWDAFSSQTFRWGLIMSDEYFERKEKN